MISVKSTMPLWKWILLIVFGSALFLFLSQTVPVVGSFSNKIWIKALLLMLVATAVLGLYAVWVKVFERRKVSELRLQRAFPDLMTGLLIGGLFISCVVGVLVLMGVYRVDAVNIDWVGLLLSFAAFSIVAVCEEVLFRGILFRMIDERYGALLAFIISSLTFGAVHLMTVDFWTALAISAEAGFMLAAAYKFRNNLWIPIGIHWTWNFTLGPVFGVGVSGISEDAYAIIPEISGPYILTGGNNGFEGSIVTVIIGIAVGILMLVKRKR
ncbi:MAG: type II CAAX endopeptidase family protein [Candidatus Coprenecus sp.]|nr:type II CAAX endopeptidase family protein [Candidatus Coprenecus sp.]